MEDKTISVLLAKIESLTYKSKCDYEVILSLIEKTEAQSLDISGYKDWIESLQTKRKLDEITIKELSKQSNFWHRHSDRRRKFQQRNLNYNNLRREYKLYAIFHILSIFELQQLIPITLSFFGLTIVRKSKIEALNQQLKHFINKSNWFKHD